MVWRAKVWSTSIFRSSLCTLSGPDAFPGLKSYINIATPFVRLMWHEGPWGGLVGQSVAFVELAIKIALTVLCKIVENNNHIWFTSVISDRQIMVFLSADWNFSVYVAIRVWLLVDAVSNDMSLHISAVIMEWSLKLGHITSSEYILLISHLFASTVYFFVFARLRLSLQTPI